MVASNVVFASRPWKLVHAVVAAIALVFCRLPPTAAQAGPLVIGAPVSLTGSFASSGVAMSNAMRLFVALANAAGGVRIGGTSTPLTLQLVNDNSTEAGAIAAAATLVAGGARILVGPYSVLTGATLRAVYAPAMPTVTLLSPTASDSGLFAPYPLAFGIIPPAGTRFIAALRILQTRGARTVLALAEALDFTLDACSFNATLVGLTSVAAPVMVNNSEASVRAAVNAVDHHRPDIVILCTLYAVTNAVIADAKRLNVNAGGWVAYSVFDDPRFTSESVLPRSLVMDVTTRAPPDALGRDNLAIDSTCATYSPIGCTTIAAFTAAYNASYGAVPPGEAVVAFTAMDILSQAASRAGSVGAAAVAAAMASGYAHTMYGRVSFGLVSRQGLMQQSFRQAQDGGVALIAPTETARNALIYPVPPWAELICTQLSRCGANGLCRSDGSCHCLTGFGGATCAIEYGLPVFLLALLLGVAAIVAAAAFLMRRHFRRRAAAKQRVAAQMQAAVEAMHAGTLAFAAHEMGNPIFTIVAAAEEALAACAHNRSDREEGDSGHVAAFTAIAAAGRRLRHIMSDMATSAGGGLAVRGDDGAPGDVGAGGGAGRTMETPAPDVQLEVTTFGALIRDVRHRLLHVHGADMTVRVSGAGDLTTRLVMDPLHLYQVLLHAAAHIWFLFSQQQAQRGQDHRGKGDLSAATLELAIDFVSAEVEVAAGSVAAAAGTATDPAAHGAVTVATNSAPRVTAPAAAPSSAGDTIASKGLARAGHILGSRAAARSSPPPPPASRTAAATALASAESSNGSAEGVRRVLVVITGRVACGAAPGGSNSSPSDASAGPPATGAVARPPLTRPAGRRSARYTYGGSGDGVGAGSGSVSASGIVLMPQTASQGDAYDVTVAAGSANIAPSTAIPAPSTTASPLLRERGGVPAAVPATTPRTRVGTAASIVTPLPQHDAPPREAPAPAVTTAGVRMASAPQSARTDDIATEAGLSPSHGTRLRGSPPLGPLMGPLACSRVAAALGGTLTFGGTGANPSFRLVLTVRSGSDVTSSEEDLTQAPAILPSLSTRSTGTVPFDAAGVAPRSVGGVAPLVTSAAAPCDAPGECVSAVCDKDRHGSSAEAVTGAVTVTPQSPHVTAEGLSAGGAAAGAARGAVAGAGAGAGTGLRMGTGASATSAAATSGAAAKPRVLVVEDEKVNARLVARMAVRSGWLADILNDGVHLRCTSAEEASALRSQYACILLDIVMPLSSGIDVVKRLRGCGFDGFVAAMTAGTSDPELATYERVGFDAVLGKPFNVDDLARVLRLALARGGDGSG